MPPTIMTLDGEYTIYRQEPRGGWHYTPTGRDGAPSSENYDTAAEAAVAAIEATIAASVAVALGRKDRTMKPMPETIRPFSDQLQKALSVACVSCAEDHDAGIGLSDDGTEITVVHGSPEIEGDSGVYSTLRMTTLFGVQGWSCYESIIAPWIRQLHAIQLLETLRIRDRRAQRVLTRWAGLLESPDFIRDREDEAARTGRSYRIDEMSATDAEAWLDWINDWEAD